MHPSELVREMGKPVAYYPGLVKHLGSVNAVLLFCQFFYWTGKETSPEGIYKSVEDIERETGLTYREQATARKQLKSRGLLTETRKRLEHRIYYRVNTDRLDALLHAENGNSCNSLTDKCAVREETKVQLGRKQKCSSRRNKTAVREEADQQFDHTENTTENTTEITALDDPPVAEKTPPGKEKITETELQAACRETWRSYCEAYFSRYGTHPVRNQTVNSQIKNFVRRVGMSVAPPVAKFYVSLNDGFYVRKCHPVGNLLADAEGLHTQWATGVAMTGTRARQVDQSQANADAAGEAIAMLRARRNAGG